MKQLLFIICLLVPTFIQAQYSEVLVMFNQEVVIYKDYNNNYISTNNSNLYRLFNENKLISARKLDRRRNNPRNIFLLSFDQSIDTNSVIQQLLYINDVLIAEENQEFEVASSFPNDPFFVTFQKTVAYINRIAGWEISTGSKDIVIGIIDTGVNWYHEDLKDNIWINECERLSSEDIIIQDINGQWIINPVHINGEDDCNNG